MSFEVVILSANAANLVACVRSVLANEPDLPPERVIVVDDGAREEAERLLPPVRWLRGARPFVFGRNANLGIHAADGDVILLNDDARLETPGGFSALTRQVRRHERPGICSAAIPGMVGNPRQLAQGGVIRGRRHASSR
jgi:glycosyltransferase involved in cell wall biosynthesis